MANDRGDSFRTGARAARPLPGRLDYIRDQLSRVAVLVIEAARDADAAPGTRWAASELATMGADVAELVSRCRELRAEVMGPNALGAPVPLELRPTTERTELVRTR